MEIENEKAAAPLELLYWDMRGIAQPIRHILEYIGVNYVEKIAECPNKYYTKDIQEVKKRCVSGNLPLLSHNDLFITEPMAIVKYICRKFGREELLGKTIKDQCKIDELLTRFSAHRNRICDKINQSAKYNDCNVRRDMLRKEFQ